MSQAKLVEISSVALRLKSSALRFKGTTSQKIVECSIPVTAGYFGNRFCWALGGKQCHQLDHCCHFLPGCMMLKYDWLSNTLIDYLAAAVYSFVGYLTLWRLILSLNFCEVIFWINCRDFILSIMHMNKPSGLNGMLCLLLECRWYFIYYC